MSEYQPLTDTEDGMREFTPTVAWKEKLAKWSVRKVRIKRQSDGKVLITLKVSFK